MTRNDVSVRTGKGGKGTQRITVKLIGANTGRNRRFVSVRRHVFIRRRIVLIRSILTAVVAETTPAIVPTLVTAASIIATLETTTIPTVTAI